MIELRFSIKKQEQTGIGPQFGVYQCAIYIAFLVICFVFFQQGDLFHTITSAEGYLNGHILDFYDYNKQLVFGNDYFPTLYIIFAIWLLPFKVMSVLTHTALPVSEFTSLHANGWTLAVIVWAKLLLVVIFVALVRMTYQIAQILSDGCDAQSKWVAALLATSPIAIFSVFIFGQYDVIGLFIAMTGFYYYLQKKLVIFSILFSIAISCKLFPIVMFVPLLLLIEKKPSQLLKYAAIVSIVPLLQIAVYWHNEAFRSYTLLGGVAADRMRALSEGGLSSQLHAPYLILLYMLICFYTYIKEPFSRFDHHRLSVFVVIASYGVFFSTTVWHPQWLIFITPFFALSVRYLFQKEKFYLISLIGSVAYFVMVVMTWPQNVDASMLQYGILRALFPYKPLILAHFLAYGIILYTMKAVLMIYLFSPVLIFMFQKGNPTVHVHSKTEMTYFNARFTLGLTIFLIPMFICGFLPTWVSSTRVVTINGNVTR